MKKQSKKNISKEKKINKQTNKNKQEEGQK